MPYDLPNRDPAKVRALLGHIQELMAIPADVRCLVGHNEMVLGVDCGLHVVADDSAVLAARCHRTRIWIGQ
jgi:hypothetical protein